MNYKKIIILGAGTSKPAIKLSKLFNITTIVCDKDKILLEKITQIIFIILILQIIRIC